jgi:hypothetical protein
MEAAMTERERLTATPLTCPTCGALLASDSDLLRCAEHGQFFRYGPRLLVQVARTEAAKAPLLPWQTVEQTQPA